jgi:magnesium transporter
VAVIRIAGEKNSAGNPFLWIDAFEPSEKDLLELGEELGIPEEWIQNCLLPDHLPILEGQKVPFFLVVRVYDESEKGVDDSIPALTRKIIFFILENAILTVHRKDLGFFEENRRYWQKQSELEKEPFTREELLGDLLLNSLETFLKPLNALSEEVEALGLPLFENSNTRNITPHLYRLKRKVSVLKRLLRMTHDLFIRSTGRLALAPSNEALIKERAQSLFFTADEMSESLESLVNQVFTIDAQKTNDTMRVLTVYSVFFMPLNLLAGIFGMNFDIIPLSKHPDGFWICVGAMGGFAIGVLIWRFRRERSKQQAGR